MNDSRTEPSPERHSLARWLLVAFALLVVAGGVTMITLLLPRMKAAQKDRTVVLTGGGKLEFLGASLGRAAFTTDKPWMAHVRKILPAPLQRWLPAEFKGVGASTSNGLTAWFRSSASGTGTPPAINWGNTTTEDDAGFQYASGSGYGSYLSGQTSALDVILRAYPRRQKDFLLHLVDKQGTTVATFRVPNPDAGPFPSWQPLPMPQKLTNGPVTLTLSKLEQRRSENGSFYLNYSWGTASTQSGWSNANVRYCTLLDATGNEGQYLSPRESAWKVRAQVMRPNPSDFVPTEKMTLTNLAVQATNHFLAIDRTNLAVGVGINVSVLCGPGNLAITNGTIRVMRPPQNGILGHSTYGGSSEGGPPFEEWGATNSFFLVDVANVQPNDEIQFYLHDDRGRDIKVETTGWSITPNGGRVYQPKFTAPADAASVTLEVIVDRPLVFDFLVSPKDVQPVQP